MSRPRKGWRVIGLALLVLLLGMVAVAVFVDRRRGQPVKGYGPRTAVPALGSTRLGRLPEAERPPAPVQWQGGPTGIPSNQWWSSAVVGPGTATLWTTPLAVRVLASGRVEVAAEAAAEPISQDGSTRIPFVPAWFLPEPAGGAATTVVGWGALHVVLRLADRSGRGHLDVTLTRGNVVAELEVVGRPLSMLIPGLAVVSQDERTTTFQSSRGRWVIASDVAVRWQVAGDELTVAAGNGQPFRLAVGPQPVGAADWPAVVRGVAENPLVGTQERLEASEVGSVRQVLTFERTHDAPTPLALQPHQRSGLVSSTAATEPLLGTVRGATAPHDVRLTGQMTIDYRLPGALWSAVWPAGSVAAVIPEERTGAGASPDGSYFGGKAAYRDALLADITATGGQRALSADALGRVRARFDRLVAGQGPAVTWEETWGSLVLTPAEFGAGSELNDHQLQGGYWVAAASLLAENDRPWGRLIRPLVDALIADYAGTDVVPPQRGSGLPAMRTWSPYDGHSWASGVVPFDDGNNLESISEAIFSSWAAARWFVVSGRPKLAEPFLARLAIEQTVADGQWLPVSPVGDGATRPWSGVVWAGKVDQGTWFSPLAEAALGIRLLPLGPQSLARYATQDATAAAQRRWAWCDGAGDGCGALWPNLLASDAIAAGRPATGTVAAATGPSGQPEASTSAGALAWWAALFEALPRPADGVACSAGAVARRRADGAVVALASNPGAEAVTLTCVTAAGGRIWQAVLKPGERRADVALASRG